jgi:hypothetical protein
MVRGEVAAEVGGGAVRLRLGWLGRVEFPVADVVHLSRVNWPWWGGLGARLGRRMVAYTTSWGEAVVVELAKPVDARMPMRWKADRVILGVEDTGGFMDAIARERRLPSPSPTPPASR